MGVTLVLYKVAYLVFVTLPRRGKARTGAFFNVFLCFCSLKKRKEPKRLTRIQFPGYYFGSIKRLVVFGPGSNSPRWQQITQDQRLRTRVQFPALAADSMPKLYQRQARPNNLAKKP